MATQLMVKTPENIRQAALTSLQNGQALLNKSYLAQLENYNPMLLTKDNTLSYGLDTRLYKIERIVLENKQSALESLIAAYTALGSAGYTVFLFLKSNGIETDIYLGVKGIAQKMMGAEAGKLVEQVFKGHFAGSQLTSIDSKETEKLLFGLNQTEQNLPPSITGMTGVPSPYVVEREFFMQGLEKFIDAAEGRCYQALILAEPVDATQLNSIQLGYESVATQLSPLLKQSLSFGENENESVGLSIGESINQSFGTSLSLTETKGTSESISSTFTTGRNESTTNTFTTGNNESSTTGTSFSETSQSSLTKGVAIGGTLLGAATGIVAGPLVAGAVGLLANTLSTAVGKTETSSSNFSRTTGTSTSESSGTTHGTSTSESKGTTHGTSYNKGLTTGSTSTDTLGKNYNQSVNNTLGSNRQISLDIIDKGIEQLLKQVDLQLERVAEARRYGAWHTAAYFIGDSTASSRSLASVFLGLMRGENSNSENFALTTWNSDKSKMLLPWLRNLTHPRLMSELSRNLNIPYFTPATLVSGKEMAIQLSLPRRSTSTVSVVEARSFARQIQGADGSVKKADKTVNLGVVRHLWTDLPQKVKLDVKKLASHIFISGSTGSGKSNTVYQLLDQLNKNDVNFMVIEPVKGEYKNVFGHRENVTVFGTNPSQAQLLKINPFKFPKDIHVLEHIDRLVEIFNVCWPMYAAMPAVLKDAMLESYQASGWDLETSYNSFDEEYLFPTFADLLVQLEKVIKKSAFSQEVKSNYIGSLVTRVKSLTNGLNGQIFSPNEIDNTQLFDSNVIVDLSRIGSQETKSLIMGILVMRLNEYRMSNAKGMNQPLQHVTVLEEAHNILKRTSTEQTSEGANVVGKAVEMLSNAITEMRTYGEGFIIADQSPSAVDISAIRNTNTKIIMRLPDETDRRLAGKASGATDEQLEEIAKLPKGVAVIYQNDWLEPVLCKIHHFNSEEKLYKYQPKLSPQTEKKAFYKYIADLLFSKKTNKQLELTEISQSIKYSTLGIEYKNYFLGVINHLEKNTVPPILEKDDPYLIDLYQRIIQQHIDEVKNDLSVEVQRHLAKIM